MSNWNGRRERVFDREEFSIFSSFRRQSLTFPSKRRKRKKALTFFPSQLAAEEQRSSLESRGTTARLFPLDLREQRRSKRKKESARARKGEERISVVEPSTSDHRPGKKNLDDKKLMLVLLFTLCFAAHAGMLAASLYGLVLIADLESDFVNPHDCAAGLNKWLVSFLSFFEEGKKPEPAFSRFLELSSFLSHFPSLFSLSTNLQLPEYATQSATALLFLLTRSWVPALAHGALSLKLWRGYRGGDATVDVTEVFKQAPSEKRRRAWRLAAYLVSFVYVIYRLVEAAVSSLLTPEGRAAAHKLLVEAAAAPHV